MLTLCFPQSLFCLLIHEHLRVQKLLSFRSLLIILAVLETKFELLLILYGL